MALTLEHSTIRATRPEVPSTSAATLGTESSTSGPSTQRMEKFVIEGGVPLGGTITPAGNKNAALPILAACLLTDERVILRNVPQIRDVEVMLELLESLGVTRHVDR